MSRKSSNEAGAVSLKVLTKPSPINRYDGMTIDSGITCCLLLKNPDVIPSFDLEC